VAKANQEKYNEAIADFTLSLDVEPTYTSALSNRGIAYYKIREYDKAVADLNAAIALEPHNGNTYMYRGNVKEMMRDKQGALDDWKKASTLGIKIADRYFKDNCN
jgi:tetratricopeptide (TPR) repeat protein